MIPSEPGRSCRCAGPVRCCPCNRRRKCVCKLPRHLIACGSRRCAADRPPTPHLTGCGLRDAAWRRKVGACTGRRGRRARFFALSLELRAVLCCPACLRGHPGARWPCRLWPRSDRSRAVASFGRHPGEEAARYLRDDYAPAKQVTQEQQIAHKHVELCLRAHNAFQLWPAPTATSR